MAEQQFRAPNGDQVTVTVADERPRRETSAFARERSQRISEFRRAFFVEHHRPPSAGEINALLREMKGKK